jgi:hypothetical protein
MTTATRSLFAVLAVLAGSLLGTTACGGRTADEPLPPADSGPPRDTGPLPDSPSPEGGVPDSGTCPASGVDNGASCSDEGETCSTYYSQCGGPPTALPCTCIQGAWSCEVISGGCGGPVCPDPSTIVPGGACSTPPSFECTSDIAQYDCAGNFVGDVPCTCYAGGWACVSSTPACIDAGPPGNCPDPTEVEQGVACSSPFQQCAGNPTQCDGATFYDDFECDGGTWNDIAPTVCEGGDAGFGG